MKNLITALQMNVLIKTKQLYLVFIILAGSSFSLFSAAYYVDTLGNDSNPGTKDQPFKTIGKAYNVLTPGDTAFVFPGDYSFGQVRLSGNNGRVGNLLHIFAVDNGDKPVIKSGIRIRDCAWLHLKGFELTEKPMSMHGKNVHHCIIENFDIHHVDAQIGLSLHDLTHDNLILNCDFHHNVQFTGSNSDGIAIWANEPSSTNGPYNNTVRFCRSFFNNDDGFDTWCAGKGNRFEYCWSFGNGRDSDFNDIPGDGNGFKLGQGEYNYPTVVNCLAWKNKTRGFDENSNQAGGVTVYNSTGYDNGNNNFGFWALPTTDKVINCVSFDGGVTVGGADDSYNNWNLNIRVTADDFVTTDFSANMGPRKPDGSLPDSDFLKLKSTSALIDRGTDLGMPFVGAAPDLGAYEYGDFTLAVTVIGDGEVTPAGGPFNDGDIVTLTATPAEGWDFAGWSGDLSGTTNPVDVTMSADKNITATFSPPLSVQKTETTEYGFKIFPNPFNAATSIEYSLEQLSVVQISVYNTLGQKVRTLEIGVTAAQGKVIWDGTDELGAMLNSGIYYVKMSADEKNYVRKIVYLK